MCGGGHRGVAVGRAASVQVPDEGPEATVESVDRVEHGGLYVGEAQDAFLGGLHGGKVGLYRDLVPGQHRGGRCAHRHGR